MQKLTAFLTVRCASFVYFFQVIPSHSLCSITIRPASLLSGLMPSVTASFRRVRSVFCAGLCAVCFLVAFHHVFLKCFKFLCVAHLGFSFHRSEGTFYQDDQSVEMFFLLLQLPQMTMFMISVDAALRSIPDCSKNSKVPRNMEETVINVRGSPTVYKFPRRFPYSIRPDYRRIRSRSSVTVLLTERLRFLYHNADRICRQGGREL